MMSLSSLFDLLGVSSIYAVLELLGAGFRFRPTDQELMSFLKDKMSGNESKVEMIPLVDVCKYEPWDLPDVIAGRSALNSKNEEWFCFSTPDYKYRNSSRVNRATDAGYWKPTGQDRQIKALGAKRVIGKKKTLVFYKGRVPNGVRTNWVIHEYHPAETVHPDQMDFVLCRLMQQLKKGVKTKQSNDDLGDTNNNLACDSNLQTPQYPMLQEHAMMQESQEPLSTSPNQTKGSGLSFSMQSSEHNSGYDVVSECAIAEENQDPLIDILHLLEYSEILAILQSPRHIEHGLSLSDLSCGSPVIQENQEPSPGSLHLREGSDLPSIVQSAEYNDTGLSLSDLELLNDLIEKQGQVLPLKDLVGNEGKLSQTVIDSDKLEDKTEFVNSLFNQDNESCDDSSSVLLNVNKLPESLMLAEEAIRCSNVENETPVGAYPPNDTGGYISSRT